MLNSYGPTECTDVAVAGALDPSSGSTDVPLGKPVDNVKLLVCDAHGNALPLGLPGELYIGGIGVGEGYINQAELTAQQFADRVVDGERGRYYATGDVTPWRPDGQLDYLGRADQQVKLRGFRIELGEIEALLREQAGVVAAAATVHRSGRREQLVAFVVAEDQLDTQSLHSSLERQLPDYMVPDHIVSLDGLPLTPNGKLDRRALPAPTEQATEVEQPPRGATETQLADIWRTVLGIDAIDRNTSFFSLGGHSLLAVQLVARIADAFNVDVPLRATARRH